MVINLVAMLMYLCGLDSKSECIKERIFDLSFPNPYTKVWEDPLTTLGSCFDSILEPALTRQRDIVTLNLRDSLFDRISIYLERDSASGKCKTNISLMRNLPANWNLDSLHTTMALYSDYNAKYFRQNGEYSIGYRQSEIRDPSTMYAKAYLGKNGVFGYNFWCTYPVQSVHPCLKYFSHSN